MGTGLNVQTVVNLVVEVEICSIEKKSTTLLPQNMAVNIAIVQHIKAILMEKLNAKYLQNLFFYQKPYTKFSFFSSKYEEYCNFDEQKKKKTRFSTKI